MQTSDNHFQGEIFWVMMPCSAAIGYHATLQCSSFLRIRGSYRKGQNSSTHKTVRATKSLHFFQVITRISCEHDIFHLVLSLVQSTTHYNG